MNPRSILGFLGTLLVVAILIGIGAGIYQAGVSQGIVDAGRFPAGAAVPVAGYAGYGWGHGFGFLGFLVPLFFILLVFGLLRAAFGRGRGWGGGYGHGYGWGKGWGPGYGAGPEAWREERERRMSELHRQLHEEEAKGSTSGDRPDGSASSRS